MRPGPSDRRRPRPDDYGARVFDVVVPGEHVRLTVPDLDLRFDLDRLRRERGVLVGHLTVRCGIKGARFAADDIVTSSRLDLGSVEARRRLAGILQDRTEVDDVDWSGYLEELAVRTERADRVGTPPVSLLTDVALRPVDDDAHDVLGLRLLRAHPTMLYGLGGTLKSYLLIFALGVLAARGIRTLLVDWELDDATHKRRLVSLFGVEHPDVLYYRANAPMTVEADRLAPLVHDAGIGYLGLDSAGFGCSGPPENAEEALGFLRAVRRLGVGSLILAHQRKGDDGDKMPFGSVFWFNGCRQIYHVKRSTEAALDESVVGVGCFPTKNNLGPRGQHVGFEVRFTADTVTLTRRAIADLGDDLAAALPLRARIRHELRRGPKTYIQLAEELNANVKSIERTVQRHTRTFTRLDGPDGVLRVALLDEAI